ncbi:hypothetical protein QUW37_02960 [Ligilactobacillus aviarius]|uniref:Sugar specific permease n=1 Tax=Ligilactobacillus aviarius TaxID=1606 RepID=A0A510WQI6_9LACO|nr:hypothetical protein [Ligilactobacillus aviarius]KRM38434.1 hypothetical protein FC33_GL000517 [Ligilactobacillus aviarius subsp. aviarius DSM 20655]MDM8278181.1 hypothetical protein [Ligilactobacillus aviarius]GEK41436.1 hypothetical protein LAV01_02680 [Ligilactobacillus aviarius]
MEIHDISKLELAVYFGLSIIINSFGNALTVALNLGSPLWTATCVNVSQTIHWSLGNIMVIWGALLIIINTILIRKIDLKRIGKSIIFMVLFSYLVSWLSSILKHSLVMTMNLPMRILFDLFGICLVSLGVSMYQRVNWMLHPADDLMQIVRFKFFNGNSTKAMFAVYLPAIIIVAITFLISHQIVAINIGTIFGLLFQGPMIGICDRICFKRLKHHNLDH